MALNSPKGISTVELGESLVAAAVPWCSRVKVHEAAGVCIDVTLNIMNALHTLPFNSHQVHEVGTLAYWTGQKAEACTNQMGCLKAQDWGGGGGFIPGFQFSAPSLTASSGVRSGSWAPISGAPASGASTSGAPILGAPDKHQGCYTHHC